jgi:hypothetical protein
MCEYLQFFKKYPIKIAGAKKTLTFAVEIY